jgi:hypothetical protein
VTDTAREWGVSKTTAARWIAAGGEPLSRTQVWLRQLRDGTEVFGRRYPGEGTATR